MQPMIDRRARQLMAGLVDIMTKAERGTISPKTAAKRLRDAAQWLEEGEQQELDVGLAKPQEPPSEGVKSLFSYWADKTSRGKSVKLTAPRAATIKMRLSEGFTPNQLRSIIDWAADDPFHRGDNERETRYDWIETIFRSHERTEKNLEKAQRSTVGSITDGCQDDKKRRKLIDLERAAAEATANEQFERYNEIQREIARLRNANSD